MEYEKTFSYIGNFGKFQKILLCLLAIPAIFNAGTTHMFNFILGNQQHRCHLPDIIDDHYALKLEVVNESTLYNASQCSLNYNGTEMACYTWVYDQSTYTSTLISKFDLVCDNKLTRSHILSSFFFGQLFGSVIFGTLTDLFGRKPVLLGSIATLFLSNITTPWMPSTILVGVCQFFNALGGMGQFYVSVILACEMVDPPHRSTVTFVTYLGYCFGEYVLLLEAYLARDFMHLMIVLSAPIILCPAIFIFVPESPRWLISKGRKEEAKTILKNIAKTNNSEFNVGSEDLMISDKKQKVPFKESVIEILHSWTMLKRIMILIVTWIAINLVYYGIGMNVGDLGGNVYINFAASATAETVAVIMCFWTEKFPRRILFSCSMIFGSVACLLTIFTSYFGNDSFNWMTICLAMMGKLGISVGFFMVILITTEMFPTCLRASVLGVCNMAGKIGALISPYIGKLGVLIDSRFGVALPIIIFGIVGLVAGLLDLILPETRNMKLADTVEEAAVNCNRSHRNESQSTAENEMLGKDDFKL